MNKIFNFKHYNVIKETIEEINNDYSDSFMTFGKWHSYELLLYILSFTGVSDVVITTFGLSEEGIRAIQRAKKEGYINKVTIIINLSARIYKKKLLYYLENVVDEIWLQNIHAKIFLIKGENFDCIVNQSANFSTNPTNESGFISTKPKDILKYSNFIDKTIEISKKLKLSS